MFKKTLIRNRKIKIAVVGCGKIAQNHFQAIQAHANDLELVAICDPHLETLQRVAQEQKVAAYQSIDELILKSDVDTVTLCTPSGLHAQQTLQLAASGKHVITEKPMTLHVNDGVKMVAACDAANVRLFVVKQNRYHPTLQLLKHAIAKNRFGKIYLINLNVFWTRPQAYYDQSNWRGTGEMDGGAFMNQASHYVDLLDWLFGPVRSIHAMMDTLGRSIAVEDTGILNLRWSSGALGSMNVTMLTYPKNYEASLTILGEKGTVKIGGTAVNEIQTWEFADKSPEDETIAAINQATIANLSSHIPYYENVIQVLRGEADPQVDGREGLKSLEILTAAYMSAKNNNTISLPLEITNEL